MKTLRKIIYISGVVLILAIFWYLRPRQAGFILGEPDEIVHLFLAINFRELGIPYYGGQMFFYELPLYFYISSLASYFFQDGLLATRSVSYISYLLTGMMIIYYLRVLTRERWLPFFGGIIFLFLPLSVFYSRVGIIEPFLSLFLFQTIVFFHLALVKNNKLFSILSGVALGLSFFTKYTAVPYLLLIVLIFFWRTLKINRDKGITENIKIDLISFFPISIATAMVTPAILWARSLDPFVFTFQTKMIFGLGGGVGWAVWPKTPSFVPDWFNFSNLFFWFSSGFLLLIVLSLLVSMARSNHRFLSLSFIFILYFVFGKAPFYQRYLYILLPFMAVLPVFLIASFRGKARYFATFFTILAILSILPKSKLALESARHSLLEDSVSRAEINLGNSKEQILFSNFWPNFYGYLAKTKRFSWLSLDTKDVQNYYPEAKENAFKLLSENGGYVFLEKLYSPTIAHPHLRSTAFLSLKEIRKPDIFVFDRSPNFPFFETKENIVEIYRIEKGEIL